MRRNRLNALSGIGGVQTLAGAMDGLNVQVARLNALSGIGGVQTTLCLLPSTPRSMVLMPCRALEAFRLHRTARWPLGRGVLRLNALSGIGGVQTSLWVAWCLHLSLVVLMPCRALEAFRRRGQRSFCQFPPRPVLMPCRALEAFRRTLP